MALPDFIVHYNRSEPFRSMSDVSQESLPELLSTMNEDHTWGLNRFSDPEYLPQRIQVEKKIRHEFNKKGGRPELKHPLYFFLGFNARFEEHKKNIAYKIQLNDLPSTAMSFTYGDSMFSMCENYRRKLNDENLSRLCSQVYLLGELEKLNLATQDHSPKLHIECQLWMKPTPNIFTRVQKGN